MASSPELRLLQNSLQARIISESARSLIKTAQLQGGFSNCSPGSRNFCFNKKNVDLYLSDGTPVLKSNQSEFQAELALECQSSDCAELLGELKVQLENGKAPQTFMIGARKENPTPHICGIGLSPMGWDKEGGALCEQIKSSSSTTQEDKQPLAEASKCLAQIPGAQNSPGDFRACGSVQKQSFEEFSALDKKWDGISLNRSSFSNSTWKNVDLNGANFWGSRLDHSKFMSGDLSGADFTLASLQGSLFDSVKMASALFRASQMKGAKFLNMDLKGVSFEEADLSYVVFENVTLDGGSFLGANLTGTQFNKVKMISPAKWPAGYTPSFIRAESEGLNAPTMLWLFLGICAVVAISMLRSIRR